MTVLQELEEAHDQLLRGFLGMATAWQYSASELSPCLKRWSRSFREMVGKEVCCLRLDGRYNIREVGP